MGFWVTVGKLAVVGVGGVVIAPLLFGVGPVVGGLMASTILLTGGQNDGETKDEYKKRQSQMASTLAMMGNAKPDSLVGKLSKY